MNSLLNTTFLVPNCVKGPSSRCMYHDQILTLLYKTLNSTSFRKWLHCSLFGVFSCPLAYFIYIQTELLYDLVHYHSMIWGFRYWPERKWDVGWRIFEAEIILVKYPVVLDGSGRVIRLGFSKILHRPFSIILYGIQANCDFIVD